MTPNEVERYRRDVAEIRGWFPLVASSVFGLFDEIQKECMVEGPLFEIGAFQGKTSIMLGRMRRGDERLVVCDPFYHLKLSPEQQEAIFRRNMTQAFADLDFLDVLARPSTTLSPGDLNGPFRFIHIDASHLPDETTHELMLAKQTLSKEGVLAMDDVFDARWPAVVERLCKFMFEHPGEFVPVFIAPPKVFLARPAFAEKIAPRVRERASEYLPTSQYELLERDFFSRAVPIASGKPGKWPKRIKQRISAAGKNIGRSIKLLQPGDA